MAEKVIVAIQEFDQCPLNVIIPLVPGFEREVFKAPFRFPLRHLIARIIVRGPSTAKI